MFVEKWELAYDDYLTGMKYKDIANKHGVSLDTVKNWKRRKWPKVTPKHDPKTKSKGSESVKRTENRGGPERHQKTTTHGLYSKWLPDEIKEIIGVTPTDPLDLLWTNIELQNAKIIRSFKLQAVKDRNDVTKRVISSTDGAEVYSYKEAFEKDNAFLQGLSRAMGTLSNMIGQYEKMLAERGEMATALQQARLEEIQINVKRRKAEIEKIRSDLEGTEGSAVQIVDDIPDRGEVDE